MEEIERLRNNYYNSLLKIQEEEVIKEILPKPYQDNFFEIMDELIQLLESDLEVVVMLLEDAKTPVEIEYAKDQKETTELKIRICKEALKKAKDDIQKLEIEKATTRNNIIFASTPNGRICLDSDLKDFPKEYYGDVLRCINALQSEVYRDGITFKPLVNNAEAKDLYEVKVFKVRIIYKRISSDTVYILMARMKKTDSWTTADRREISSRYKRQYNQYEVYRKLIANPTKKEELIEENQKIFEDIQTKISQKKR